MQEQLLFVCYAIVLLAAASQPLYLIFSLLRGSASLKSGHGPYRDPRDAQLQSARAEIQRLTQALATAEREKEQKDQLIENLWFRIHGPKRTITYGRVATAISLAAASGIVIGGLWSLPSQAESAAVYPQTMRPTMQATWGGEITLRESETWNWTWQCRTRQPTLLAIGSTVTRVHCDLPIPELRHTGYTSEGDRAWILWYFPERTGPATLTYVLN